MLQDTTGLSYHHPLTDALLGNDRFLVLVTDTHGKILQSGAGTSRILGYTKDDLVGKIFHALLNDPHEIKKRANSLGRESGTTIEPGFGVLTVGTSSYEQIWTLIRKDRGRLPVQLSSQKIITDDQSVGFLFIGKSANNLVLMKQQLSEMQTKLTVANAKLAALSVTDELTGLKNRQAFKENLEREFRRAIRHHGPLSVILVSIDDFKIYNDKFGAAAGDNTLKTAAEGLLRSTRSTDYLARYEGVVFAFILPETDRAGAMIKANRVREDMENICWANRQLTASLGVATLGTDSPAVQGITSCSLLLDRAHKALEASKSLGGDNVSHFDETKTPANQAR